MVSHARTEPVTTQPHIAYELNDDKHPSVVIIEFLSGAIADPAHAAELSQQLCALIRPEFPKRFVLDFEDVRSLSSTAFGALISFVLKVRQADGQVAIEFDAQSGATSGLDLSDRVVGGHVPKRRSWSAHRRTVDHLL